MEPNTNLFISLCVLSVGLLINCSILHTDNEIQNSRYDDKTSARLEIPLKIYVVPSRSTDLRELTRLIESNFYSTQSNLFDPNPSVHFEKSDTLLSGGRIIKPEFLTSEKIGFHHLDLWDRIRRGFSFHYDHPSIDLEIKWFKRNQIYLDRVVDRSRHFLYFITQQVEARKFPTELVLLPIIESGFQPFAFSHGRAAGIWQFIPETGKRFGLHQTWWYDGRRDIIASTHAALNYLSWLYHYFNNDWLLALAAYNSGEGTVRRAIKKNERLHKPTDFWSLNLPNETRSYVPRLIAIAKLIEHPGMYGVRINPVRNKPRVSQVNTKGQLDLALAAELAAIPLNQIYQLNPGFNRWITDPNGPHHLLLPLEKAKEFEKELRNFPIAKRQKWKRHTIQPGENLELIASIYNTSTSILKNVNKIPGSSLQAEKYLAVPVALKKSSNRDSRWTRTSTLLAGNYKKIHSVAKGDTLWSIARNNNVSIENLTLWNSITLNDKLKLGQKITIYSNGHAQIDSLQVNNSPESQTMRAIKYIVRRGDSLAQIANKFRVSIRQLVSWNTLEVKKLLVPGQQLELYVDVTKQTSW